MRLHGSAGLWWGGTQDAARLAQKLVSNYGMSELGITVHAPPAGGVGFMRKSFEVRPPASAMVVCRLASRRQPAPQASQCRLSSRAWPRGGEMPARHAWGQLRGLWKLRRVLP